MKERECFSEILRETIIPSNLDAYNQAIRYGKLQNVSNDILPKHLFRYRTCSELNIDAFDKDEIWASTADSMNDGFDTRIFANAQDVSKTIEKFLKKNLYKEQLLNIANALLPYFSQFDSVKDQLNSISENSFAELSEIFRNVVIGDTADVMEVIPEIAQQTIKFSCFSEIITSPSMWGLYASDETGFALEYDSEDFQHITFPNSLGRQCFLLPVVYSKNRYEVPTDYIMYLLQYRLVKNAFMHTGILEKNQVDVDMFLSAALICPDVTIPTKISLHKSEEWAREAEWRLFCTSKDDIEFQKSKHGCCCILKPIGLYLGRRISQINEKFLISLAGEKNIPVYKMSLDDHSNTYNLVVCKLQK